LCDGVTLGRYNPDSPRPGDGSVNCRRCLVRQRRLWNWRMAKFATSEFRWFSA
jgi:hypothetical protein